jgi:hypothetical protein
MNSQKRKAVEQHKLPMRPQEPSTALAAPGRPSYWKLNRFGVSQVLTNTLPYIDKSTNGLYEVRFGYGPISVFSEGHRRNRSWARKHPGQRDEAWSKRAIAPSLDGFSLKEIVKATGLSLAAYSRIRAGAKAPHPRHRDALAALIAK